MVLLIISLILICLTAGGFIGYKIGSHFIRQENRTIQAQNELLRQYSVEWANAARNSSQLNGEIADRQTSNTTAAMNTVIHLLTTIQHEQSQTITTNEQQAIQRIIDEAKAISPSSEFD